MKKSILRISIIRVAVTVAGLLMLVGCEDAVSPNNNELVDGFLVRVNEKPGSAPGTGTSMRNVTVLSAGSGSSGSGPYVVGTVVSINAGTRPIPYRFIKWTANKSVMFADSSYALTTFIMPTSDVTVTANFWDYGKFIDTRDGKQYKTTIIGGMMWMAENLNYATASGSWCYEDSPDSCAKYGRLYDWNTAGMVCPLGWHLPTEQEWESLVETVGGWGVVGNKLKAANGWSYGGNGTDDYGFTALPGGGSFIDVGSYGYWWMSTERGENWAYVLKVSHFNAENAYFGESYKSSSYSVRCREDD